MGGSARATCKLQPPWMWTTPLHQEVVPGQPSNLARNVEHCPQGINKKMRPSLLLPPLSHISRTLPLAFLSSSFLFPFCSLSASFPFSIPFPFSFPFPSPVPFHSLSPPFLLLFSPLSSFSIPFPLRLLRSYVCSFARPFSFPFSPALLTIPLPPLPPFSRHFFSTFSFTFFSTFLSFF